jgi:hypothetical protein
MMAEREDDAGLFGAGAAVAADDVQGCPFHAATLPPARLDRIERPRGYGVIADRESA